MTYRKQRRITYVILLFLSILVINNTVQARDINLDEIYINPESTLYTRLIQKKSEYYEILDSVEIDSNIIFSGWISPSSIVYVKEYKSSNRNIVYQINLNDSKKRKIIDINGALIYTKLSKNGKYLICKSLKYNGGKEFSHKILVVDLENGKLHTKNSQTVFTDFTVSYRGDTIYYETAEGIVAYNPRTDSESLYLPKIQYRNYVSSENVTLCYISPKEDKVLLLNGGGGSYDGILIIQGNFSGKVEGITSSREIFWIDNQSLAFRAGYIGNYSVKIYNSSTNKYKTLVKKSLNTNITDSTYSSHISFQEDGLLFFFDTETKSMKNMLLEGEDATLSPLGDYFTSLYNKTLYVSKLSSASKNKLKLRRNSRYILSLYESIRSNPVLQENEYSSEYINRKISAYKLISQ